MPKDEDKPALPALDLTKLCRSADKLYCTVSAETRSGHRHPWLQLGAVSLRYNDRGGWWTLNARMDDTDVEHDSLYALSMGLVSLTLKFMDNHHFYYEAFLHPDPENFRVPPAGYNPRTLKGVKKCNGKQCGRGPHLVIPDGNYQPPFNVELFKMARPLLLTIQIGPVEPETEE